MPPRRRRSSPLPPPGFPKKPKHLADGDPARDFERCRKLLDKMLKHEDGWVFDKPVDARDLGILDYYSEISNPMDLGTVDRRLERRRYANPLSFAEDVRLVFRNAMTYNNEGDYAYESAILLSGIFESGWASILAAFPSVPSVAERRARLKDELPRLPVDVQGRAAVIMEDIGGCLREVDGGVEVDFDLADEVTLGELERLVADHKAPLAGAASNTVKSHER